MKCYAKAVNEKFAYKKAFMNLLNSLRYSNNNRTKVSFFIANNIKGPLSRFWLFAGSFLLLLEETMKNITVK